MDAEALFTSLIADYPMEIDLSGSKFHKNGGVTIPSLVAEHDKLEAKYLGVSDEHEAMTWSIFQGLHSEAKHLLANGVEIIQPRSLTFNSISEYFHANLDSIRKHKNESAT